MLFTSLAFAVFFPLVFLAYWFLAAWNRSIRNAFLLLASYFFYGWWNWKFLILLIALSLINYLFALLMRRKGSVNSKKIWFLGGLVINISVLVFFNYLLFFMDIFIKLVSKFGVTLKAPEVSIILPLGLSFYIFLSVSYIIDVYKMRMEPGKNVVEVLLSFSFFPILLAGPIQRPISLLPQLQSLRSFDYNLAVDGLRRILLGLFMKIVIADQLAEIVNEIFKLPESQSASTLLFGGIFYAVQIYADFAGYSEIAIGVAALLGFKLMRNFAYPYFAGNIAEFWRRWHISLTGWFRDYVFLPVAYATSRKFVKDKVGFIKTDLFIYIIAMVITWLLTGLWHGANLTFIAWGLIHGTALILYQAMKDPRKRLLKRWNLKYNNLILVIFDRLYMFIFVFVAWIFFRSDNIDKAFIFLKGLCHSSLFSSPHVVTLGSLITILLFFLAEWLQRNKEHTMYTGDLKLPVWVRWAAYYLIFVSLFIFSHKEQAFIYLQF